MKKRLILILLTVCVCAAVGVGIWLVLGIDPPKSEEFVEPGFGLTVNDEGIRVYYFSPSNVDYLNVENQYGSYCVRMTDGTVTIVGYEAIPLLQASSVGLFNSVATVTLDTVIREHCDDLSEFGLADPQAKVTIRANGGAEVGLRIGDHTLTGNYYYMCVDGEDTVFLMDHMLAERYLRSVEEYCDPKIYRMFEGITDLRTLTVRTSEREYSFRKASDEEKSAQGLYFSGFIMQSPFLWGADSTALEAVTGSFTELTATDVVKLCVSEEELALYGLDKEHAASVVLSVYADPNPITYNGKANAFFDSSQPTGEYREFSVSYRFGMGTDQKLYVMFEEMPVVYEVSREQFDWLPWTPYRFAVKMLFGEYLSALSQIDVITQERTDSFVLTGEDAGFRVVCGDVAVNADDFRNFYVNLLSVYPTGDADRGQMSGSPALTLKFYRKEGETSTVSFYPVDSRNFAAEVDGEVHLSVRVNDVNKILSDREKLLAGQKVS